VSGALYHVSAAAMPGASLFQAPHDYETYLALLAEYQGRYGFKLFAYVLLPDQVHLVLELPGEVTISTIMHALTSRYTKHAHAARGTSGHLFQARFRSSVFEKAPWLLRLTGYVHRLPTSCGVTASWQSYSWSSLGRYLAGEDPSIGPGLRGEVQEVLARLPAEAPGITYLQAIERMPAQVWDAMSEDVRRPVVGSEAFIAQAHASRANAHVRPAGGSADAAAGQRPAGGQRHTSVLTASLALAVSAAVSAGLYARNVQSLRTALRTIAQERPLAAAVPGLAPQPESRVAARPAMFALPSQLSGTAWDIQLRGQADGAARQDRLTFENGQVRSRLLGAQGVAPSNYTLSTQADGSVVWETMQTDAAGAVICWRGEWRGQVMRGMITRQLPGQRTETLTFLGVAQSERPASSPSET
jgi:REP element-mobilizing transposase RayT